MQKDPATGRVDRRLRAAGFGKDDRAVSEIVGSLLLIAITVLLVGGLSLLVLNVKPPNDTLHADLSMVVTRGPDGVWGTGNEQLRVQHNGGEVIPHDGLTIRIDIDGAVQTFADSGLTGAAFTDGEFTIGEVWTVNITVAVDAPVTVEMVLETARSSILITNSLVRAAGSCEPDALPPTVLEWTQNPSDVSASTSGAVTVTVRLVDSCVGVDETVDPHLEFRMNDGTDPAWTDLGAMSDAGTDTWTSNIPDQNWVTQISNSLQYRVTGMTDEAGNSGTSSFRSDVIQFSGGTDTFVSTHTANLGTVDSFANMRDDADGDAYATLTETTGIPPTAYYATSATGNGGSGSPSNVAGAPDDTYYVLDSNNDRSTATPFDTAGGSGTITQVTMIFESHYEGTRTDDTVDLAADAGGGFTTVLDNYVPTFGSSGNDVQQSVDITGLRGSWSFTDVQNVQLRATYDRVAGQDNMQVHIDAMWVVVTVSGSTELDVELGFPSLPAATTHVVELEYSVADEVFHVEVWDGLTWNRRGVELDQTSQTIWVYVLQGTEPTANGGSPLLRIVDDDGASPAGNIKIDYLKVVSG